MTTVCAYCDAALRYSAKLAPCIFVLAFAALFVLGAMAAIQLYVVFFTREPSRKR